MKLYPFSDHESTRMFIIISLIVIPVIITLALYFLVHIFKTRLSTSVINKTYNREAHNLLRLYLVAFVLVSACITYPLSLLFQLMASSYLKHKFHESELIFGCTDLIVWFLPAFPLAMILTSSVMIKLIRSTCEREEIDSFSELTNKQFGVEIRNPGIPFRIFLYSLIGLYSLLSIDTYIVFYKDKIQYSSFLDLDNHNIEYNLIEKIVLCQGKRNQDVSLQFTTGKKLRVFTLFTANSHETDKLKIIRKIREKADIRVVDIGKCRD